jgi:AmmeMemoRadiSam system protein A
MAPYEPPEFTPQQRQLLLRLAREAIASHLAAARIPPFETDDPLLLRPSGAFVTLWKRHDLRGCIGHVDDDKPLCRVVQEMAVAAASSDHRFNPVKLSELPGLEIEINVLSPLQRIESIDEVRVGPHGLLIVKNGHRGLLLPEVASERGWDRREFVEAVCWKAGLPKDAWRTGAVLHTFTTVLFREGDFTPQSADAGRTH